MVQDTDTRYRIDNPWWIVLGIERASIFSQVKEAYYALSIKFHPDKITGGKEIMQIINIAWENAKKEKTESNGYANTGDNANSNQNRNPSTEQTDFRQYRNSDVGKIEESELWNTDKDFPQAWREILEYFIYLPNPEIQFPILTAIALQPTAMASRNLPIVLISGYQGTGKTRILEMLSYPHRSSIINASSTYASIRDKISINKFGSKGGQGIERNTVLLFDNVLLETLDDYKLYGMFLGSYDRTSSKIIISGGGENAPLEFDVFGLSVISTIVDVERNSKYPELQRRLLPLFSQVAPPESDIGITAEYDFLGVSELYKTFWNNPDLLNFYVETRKKVRPQLKRDGRLKINQWTLVIELITTGVTCKVWKDIPEAIENFVRLFDLGKTYIRESPLEETLREILANHSKEFYAGEPSTKISTADLAKLLNTQVTNKLLEHKDVSPKEIQRIMNSHGYKLNKNCWKLIN